MKYLSFIIIFSLLAASQAMGETMYVSNIVNITLRTGPGLDRRVVKMIKSGQEVDVTETGKDWSHVSLPDGGDGWLLTRFISPLKPSGLLLSELQEKHKKLEGRSALLSSENIELKKENKQLSKDLSATKKQLEIIKVEYKTLKIESKDFLSLKSRYQKTFAELSQKSGKVQKLGEELMNKNIKLFLLGAGVLLFGFIIGISTKKNRRRSLL